MAALSPPRAVAWGLLVTALLPTLSLVPPPAAAQATPAGSAPPQTDWSGYEMLGDPTGAGFLADRFLVVASTDGGSPYTKSGVTDADPTTQGDDDPCFDAAGSDAPEVALFNVTDGGGCVNALSVGARGVTVLATSPRGGLAVAGLGEPAQTDTAAHNVVGFGLRQDGRLAQAWTGTVPGAPEAIVVSPTGSRAVVLSRAEDEPAVTVFSSSGASFGITPPDGTTVVAVSPNGRFVAVAGSDGNDTTVRIHDAVSSNPTAAVRSETIPAASDPSAMLLGDDLSVILGTDDGDVIDRTGAGAVYRATPGEAAVVLTPSFTADRVYAATGARLFAYDRSAAGLDEAWNATLGSAASRLLLGDRLVLVLGSQLSAYSRDGRPGWSTPAGAAVAVSADGRRLASVVDTEPADATDTGGPSVSGLLLHATLAVASDPATITAAPGGTGAFNVTVINRGSGVADVVVKATSPADLPVTVPADPVAVPPGGSVVLPASFIVDVEAAAGERTVTLQANATAYDAGTSQPVKISVSAERRLEVRRASELGRELGVEAGDHVDLSFLVANVGNEPLAVSLQITQTPSRGGAWGAEIIGARELQVGPQALAPVTLSVDVPDAAANGTRDRILLTARAGDLQAGSAIELVVNPFEGLTLSPERLARVVTPGAVATGTFTVGNAGTGAVNVTLQVFTLVGGAPRVPDSVTLQYPRTAEPLGVAASWPVEVRASTSPAAGAETISFTVRALTDAGVAASSSFELTIQPDPNAKPVEPPSRDTAVPAVLGVLAVLAGALALRRGHNGKR